MTWWHLESAARNNPKLKAAGKDALALWTLCGLYASEQHTDGFVPQAEFDSIVREWGLRDAVAKCFKPLVPGRGPLFEKTDGGVMVHDYGDYNPPSEEVKKLSIARSRAGRKGAESKHYGKCQEHLPLASVGSVGRSIDPVAPDGRSGARAREESSTRLARIAGWHADAMRVVRGSKAIIEDLAGAAVCEPLLASLSDADCELVVRAFVSDNDPWLADAKRRWGLRWLDAGRANRYLTPTPTQGLSDDHPTRMCTWEPATNPEHAPPGWDKS